MVAELRFQHIVNLPRIDSRIATARDSRNRIHIYLIVNHDGPVYKRNGLKGSWDPVEGDIQHSLRALLCEFSRSRSHYSVGTDSSGN